MTVYTAAKYAQTPKWVADTGGCNVFAIYTFPASGLPTLTSGDTINMIQVPAGVTIIGVILDVDKLDGGGSPAIKLNVGDSGSATRYVSQSTVGQAGGYQVPNINGAIGYLTSSTTGIFITVQTTANGAVPANANVRLLVSYTADP